MGTSLAKLAEAVESEQLKKDIPDFRPGDTVRVHAKIVEGSKERIQVFEGVVIKRSGKNNISATFTVRKVSYNIGVERTFMLHSPRIQKIVVISKGAVRRSRLFYLRPLRGKKARIKTRHSFKKDDVIGSAAQATPEELEAIKAPPTEEAATENAEPAEQS